MSVGSWQPNDGEQTLSLALVNESTHYHDEQMFPAEPPAKLAGLQPFVTVKQDLWSPVLTQLDSEQLRQVCRFFTLAETHWDGWFAGDKSPVIWICKELKKRGEFPDKSLTAWIRTNSDNRFLPYGNVLG